MDFEVQFLNELPFMIELQDGEYEVKTNNGVMKISLNSDWFKLHTAKFPKFAGKSICTGSDEDLQNFIQNNNINNYSFDNCKTFVTCCTSCQYNFTEDDYLSVKEEDCIEKIKTILLKNNIPYSDPTDLSNKADIEYKRMSPERIHDVKTKILTDNKLSSITKIYEYYEALNLLIMQYSFIRGHFWVQRLDENTLEGTIIQTYCDGKLYETTTFAGLVPSILPYSQKFPNLEKDKLEDLKNRLKEKVEIAIEDQLILVARGLWYRLEYRSAVLESSAALEIAVEKKLIEKMKNQSMIDKDIEDELQKTETNFCQRCDHFLKKYTGFSFVMDNSSLWNSIDRHRKDFRHKITHSNVIPDKKKTEEIINDFEKAIMYIRSL